MATINGTANDDVLTGTQFNDVIEGRDGNDLIDGGQGADNMYGGNGDDTYVVDNVEDLIQETASGGIDTIKTSLSEYSMSSAHVERFIYTGSGDIIVYGNAHDNYIRGSSGHDYIDGGTGADVMEGLGGNDLYLVDHVGDVIIEQDVAEENWDSVYTTITTYTLGANLEYLHANSNANYTLTGNDKRNFISGRGGDDVLDGGAGVDTMQGGKGNDTYYVDEEGETIYESDGEGIDTVYTKLTSYVLPGGIENVIFNGFTEGGVNFAGNALANRLEGTANQDTLSGGGGADTLIGFGGDDLYYVDQLDDKVVEAIGGGSDRIVTALGALVLPDNVENLWFLGPAGVAFKGTGNALANELIGGSGNDVLDGAAGADQLFGKTGNDTYVVDNAADVVWENANQGTDTVQTTLFHLVLGDNVENLVFVGEAGKSFLGGGNGLANTITGGSGDDFIDGGAGADTLVGAAGDDRYWIDNAGDTIVENVGGGVDHVLVDAGFNAYTLAANVEQMTYHGSNNFEALGNELNNSLATGGGADKLNGGLGADRMAGGMGNDIYFVDDAGDVVIETGNSGIDLVWATSSAYTMADNVERLIFGGTFGAAFTAIGNALDNEIEAGEGNDFIDGGAGADQMTGRSGNDVYIVDHLGDVVTEYHFGGTDEVRTSVGSRSDFSKMYVLPPHVENLTGTSAAAQGVYGNALDNLVKMGAGGDLVVMLDGGTDHVSGGGGNDFIFWGNSFTADDSNDGGAGFDTVGLLGNYSMTFGADDLVGIEKLAVYSAGNIGQNGYQLATVDANVAAGANLMVVGSSLSQWESLTFNGAAEKDGSFNIRGGKGADGLAGGAKADQLHGNLGADTLWGGAGNDFFDYGSAAESTYADRDHILDFTAGDRINLQAIDADNNAANGNGKFAFIGDAAFSGVAGQLRAAKVGNQWLIEGDVNGDTFADLSILVTTSSPTHAFTAADFIL